VGARRARTRAVSAAGEDAWLAAAAERFGRAPDALLGFGHDVEAVRVGAERVVVAKDVLVDGTHFDLARAGGAAAARKALAVNVSDLAASASVPLGFLVGVVLPRPPERALFDALVDGFARAGEAWACACLGGDTNVADGPLVLSVTVLGRPGPAGVLSRAGARPGDGLSVTGPLGGSLAGRHLDPRPRVTEALALAHAGVPHAMMDVSDGLLADLPRLCRASGVGAVVQAGRVPVHDDVAAGLAADERTARALGDGEDFELLLAHGPLEGAQREALEAAGVVLYGIGRVVSAAQGLTLEAGGRRGPWPAGGFDHLAR
jgi:thiamine-monophosphate kinase